MSASLEVQRLSEGHEERFEVDESTGALLKAEGDGPRRFEMDAYTGVDVGRSFGRMVVRTSGIRRASKMGMLVEHDDMRGVAVCDFHKVCANGLLKLRGYFLDDVASKGEASAMIAKFDQGWPMKASIGIRFRRHSFVEDGVEVEVNDRTFKGPLVVVEESDLFETSFIHVNPADLATGVRAKNQEQRMAKADETQPNTELTSVPVEPTAEQLKEQGAREYKAQLKMKRDHKRALLDAFPGDDEPAKQSRSKAREDGVTTSQLRKIADNRIKSRLAELEKAEQDRKTAIEGTRTKSQHVGAAFDASQAPVIQDGDRFVGEPEKRIYAEIRRLPKLIEVFRGQANAEEALKAWHKAKERLSTRDGRTPVLCDVSNPLNANPTTLKSLRQMERDILEGFDAQRLDAGSAGGDLAKVTVNGFQGQFYTSYEEQLSKNWSSELSFQIPSDQQLEIVRWLGAPPLLQEWKGPRISKSVKIYQQILQAIKFEATLGVDRFDWDHQKWDLIAKSFGLFGAVASNQWDIRFSQLLETNPTAYDGFTLYSNSHTLGGDSGTIVNDYTSTGDNNTSAASRLAVADPTQPTQLEWANILLQLYPFMMTWAWANGIKMNATMSKIGVMVPPAFIGQLEGALSSERLDLGATNPLPKSMFRAIPNPYLTKSGYGYLFRLDTNNKALLRAEPDPLEMMWMGPGSHIAYMEDRYSMGLRCVRSIAPGAFESTLRFKIGPS
jgi:Mu-like prophage major head subunit gpT